MPLVVEIPGPDGTPGNPTGIVFSGGNDFAVTKGGVTGFARFIFATEQGNLAGWAPNVDVTHAVFVPKDPADTEEASYKGLALSGNGKHVLTGSYDGTAILWEAASGKQLADRHGMWGGWQEGASRRLWGQQGSSDPATPPSVVERGGVVHERQCLPKGVQSLSVVQHSATLPLYRAVPHRHDLAPPLVSLGHPFATAVPSPQSVTVRLSERIGQHQALPRVGSGAPVVDVGGVSTSLQGERAAPAGPQRVL